jgi:hypothetical protein
VIVRVNSSPYIFLKNNVKLFKIHFLNSVFGSSIESKFNILQT